MDPSDLREFLPKLERQIWEAVVSKDGATLSRLFAAGYVEVTLDGQRVLKSDVVNESPQIDEIDAYSMNDERVVALGPEAAVLSYHLTLDGRCRGIAIEPRHRWATSVWTRSTGNWQCCLFQQSPFRENSSVD